MGNIAKAGQNYKAPTGTVDLILDVEVAKERKVLLDRIAEARDEAKGRLVTPKLKKLNEELAALTDREREHLHKLRFTKLPGMEWADLAAKFPPRLESQFDQDLGYNHHAASIAAAQHTTEAGKPVTVELLPIPEGPRDPEAEYVTANGVDYLVGLLDDEDWETILTVGAGWDIDNIVSVNLNLNVLQASNRLGRLKKD